MDFKNELGMIAWMNSVILKVENAKFYVGVIAFERNERLLTQL